MELKSVIGMCVAHIVFSFSCMALRNGAEEDATIPGDHLLYEETLHYIDPNDMLADVSLHREALKKKASQPSGLNKARELHMDAYECKNVQVDLKTCGVKLEALHQELQSKETTNAKILQQLATQGTVDYEPHYRRALSLLLKAVRSESGVSSANGSFRRHLSLELTKDVLAGLESCVQDRASSGVYVRQCDELLTTLFDSVEEHAEPSCSGSILWGGDWQWTSIQTLEISLQLLAVVIVLLVVWAATLLLWDFRLSRTWFPFLLMLLAFVFVFCCLWNWRNMIREIEAQRAADLEKQGFGGTPEECKAEGLWAWITGAEEKCTKYYTEVFISASQQISPERVIMRTLTSLLLSPLRALGRESGVFFNEFYSNVSVLYAIPASLMLLAILALSLLCCRGGSRSGSYASVPSLDALTCQLHREQQQFLRESRHMLSDICVALQRPSVTQPLLDSSRDRIQLQLNSLIEARFQALTQGAIPVDSPRSSGALQGPHEARRMEATLEKREPPELTPLRPVDRPDGGTSMPSQHENSGVLSSDSTFLDDVINVVDESFTENFVGGESNLKHDESTPPRKSLKKRSHVETPLSPSSEKFLGKVREVLES